MAVFTDKVIIITGASEGIGRALCLELATQKPKLVLAARNEERLSGLKNELAAKGVTALVVPTDVGDEGACKRLIERTVEEFGGVDVLVNNAGFTMWTNFEDIRDTSIFERIMRVNYLGSVWCAYYALPYLKKSQGRVVCVSSLAGFSPAPTHTAYAGSKHAMFGFFDTLRAELSGTGVTVTMVAPDFILTKIHKRALDRDGKPLGESPVPESKYASAQKCAAMMVRAMERRQRLLITSSRARLARWLKLIVPGLVDKVSAKVMHDATGGETF